MAEIQPSQTEQSILLSHLALQRRPCVTLTYVASRATRPKCSSRVKDLEAA